MACIEINRTDKRRGVVKYQAKHIAALNETNFDPISHVLKRCKSIS